MKFLKAVLALPIIIFWSVVLVCIFRPSQTPPQHAANTRIPAHGPTAPMAAEPKPAVDRIQYDECISAMRNIYTLVPIFRKPPSAEEYCSDFESWTEPQIEATRCGAKAKHRKDLEQCGRVYATWARWPEGTVAAHEMVTIYDENEIRGDMMFKGKRLFVTGTIDAIGEDLLGTPYVALSGPRRSGRDVQCYFDEAHREDLVRLSKRQTVKLAGTVRGLMMNIQIEDCEVHVSAAK